MRIGVDFNFNIKTDHGTHKIEPFFTSGQFKPPTFINDLGGSTGKGTIVGLTRGTSRAHIARAVLEARR